MEMRSTAVASSGNVFADLGLPDPAEREAKAMLVRAIRTAIDRQGLTEGAAAERVGLTKAKLTRIFRGIVSDVPIERLTSVLASLAAGAPEETHAPARAVDAGSLGAISPSDVREALKRAFATARAIGGADGAMRLATRRFRMELDDFDLKLAERAKAIDSNEAQEMLFVFEWYPRALLGTTRLRDWKFLLARADGLSCENAAKAGWTLRGPMTRQRIQQIETGHLRSIADSLTMLGVDASGK